MSKERKTLGSGLWAHQDVQIVAVHFHRKAGQPATVCEAYPIGQGELPAMPGADQDFVFSPPLESARGGRQRGTPNCSIADGSTLMRTVIEVSPEAAVNSENSQRSVNLLPPAGRYQQALALLSQPYTSVILVNQTRKVLCKVEEICFPGGFTKPLYPKDFKPSV